MPAGIALMSFSSGIPHGAFEDSEGIFSAPL